jgi:hypothetical protein
MRKRRPCPRLRPLLDQLDDRCLLSGFWPTQPQSNGFTPSQVTGAYGLNGTTFTSSAGKPVAANGAGETIALIEMYHDPTIQSDLQTFDAKYGLPNTTITQINQAGNQTNSGWASEEALDVEWAHATAPGASILVVEAAPSYSQTQELLNLLNAVNTARNTPGVVAVSMSWGFSEMPNESSYDSYFTTPAGHAGITFIASSGDSGGVEYPSASPNVLSVGGTTLNLTSTGSYGSETAWFEGGGGYSQFELEPGYQQGVQQTGARSTPDVAFDANPNTGVGVYATDPRTGVGSWQVVGGTSVGAPSWAGIIAIVDEGRNLAGTGSLDGPTQTLPTLYTSPSSDFHSVAAGSSSGFGGGLAFGGFDPFGGGGGFAYSYGYGIQIGWGAGFIGTPGAGATANTSTGLGSPDGPALVSALVASKVSTPLTTSGPTVTGTTSGGTTPTQPPAPVVGGSKHPGKHGHQKKHTHPHSAAAHPRSVVAQNHAAKKKHAAHLAKRG